MANLRANNLTGTGGRNAIDGSVYFSGYIDGTSADWLQLADLDDYDMGTGDFTFECWVKAAESSGEYAGIFGMYNYDNAGIVIQLSNAGVLRLVNPTALGSGSGVMGSTVIIPQDGTMGSWHHIAVARSGSTLKGFVNGIEEISTSYSSAIDFANGGGAVIGVTDRADYPGDYDLKGYISNLRLIKGSALYTANFTPPTEKLTAVAGTVLLCCQDSDNPLQEATGKTITGYGRHPSAAYDGNGEGPELVTSTGVWTLVCGGGSCSNFTVTNNGQKLSGTTVTSGYIRATYTGFNPGSKYRIKLTLTAGSNNNFSIQGYDKDGNTVTGYFPAMDGTAGNALQVGPSYVFEASGVAQWQITGSAWNTLYTFDDVSIKQIPNDDVPKVLPSVGVDEGVVFEGDTKVNSQGYMYFPTGTTAERGRGRAIWGGGQNPSNKVVMDYFQIQTGGITIDFGNLTDARNEVRACGSSTRGVWAGGRDPSVTNIIDYVEIPTTANAVDFGDLTVARAAVAAVSNQTRGCFIAGFTTPNTNHIDYITIASTGNATDFGDTLGTYQAQGRAMSPTRGLASGNYGASNLIEYITIATTGNSTDFGDRTIAAFSASGTSDNTRGVFTGGQNPSASNVIDFVTMASAGNATDFGDLITANGSSHADTSDSIIGCIAGGQSNTNTIEKITIQTTGNAVDYGDLTSGRSQLGATSDSHGGLS